MSLVKQKENNQVELIKKTISNNILNDARNNSYYKELILEESILKLYKLNPQQSARFLFSRKTHLKILFLLCFILVLIIIFPKILLNTILFIGNFIYLLSMLFKLVIFLKAYLLGKTINYKYDNNDQELPVYTILVPIYKEHKILNKLISSIKNIDYPKNKLDVKLILEEDDKETINSIKKIQPDNYFDIIIVPDSYPKTKPKACNYALKFAKGEYVTIYDAEDVPCRNQLKQAIIAFKKADKNVVCLQAKLNFFNREENLLSKFFAIEYACLFDFFVKALDNLKIPIPLGGTSNHFKREILEKLGAWDPFNVTEDADLGIRIAAYGYKTCLIDSVTLEESVLNIKSWIKQRTRWYKGFLQTYFVHMRSPLKLYKTVGLRGFLGIQVFIGLQPISYILAPLMLGLGLVNYLNDIFIFSEIIYLSIVNYSLSILLPLIMAITVAHQKNWLNESLPILLFPFYFILHILSSLRAIYQLFNDPHYWEKTEHGKTKY